MEKKSNPLTAVIFMIGILCAFVIAAPIVLLSQDPPQKLSLGYLAILLLMMAMALLYVILRAIIKRISALEEKK